MEECETKRERVRRKEEIKVKTENVRVRVWFVGERIKKEAKAEEVRLDRTTSIILETLYHDKEKGCLRYGREDIV